MRTPSQVALSARASVTPSYWGWPGKSATTSSRPTRESKATPLNPPCPWWATS